MRLRVRKNIKKIGLYSWPDGRRYEGDWQNNKMHGKGKYFWPDGRSHEGEYLDDKKHGRGIYSWYLYLKRE